MTTESNLRADGRRGGTGVTRVGLGALAASLVLIGSSLPAAATSVVWTPRSVLASLPPDALSQVTSVSCAAADDCSAVGDYVAGSGDQQALVVTEVSGKWSAGKMPALPQSSASGSVLNSVSCASPGNCSAGGYYVDSGQFDLILNETAGAWSKGITVKLPGGPGSTPFATVLAVSCAAAGDCSAVGDFESAGAEEGLLMTETSGVWATGTEGAAPAGGRVVFLYDVSCPTAGNCGAVGTYLDGSGNTQGLLLSEVAGKWSAGLEATLPGNATSFQTVSLESISCRSAGNCSAVGSYVDSLGNRQGLLLSEVAGKWATGVETSLPTGASSSQDVTLSSVSCASPGNCAAVGRYTGSSGTTQPLLLSESAGKWGTAVKGSVPKGAAANPDASTSEVSCASAADCTAAGTYLGNAGNEQGYVFTETANTWAPAVEATAPAGGTSAYLDTVSCASAGNCSSGGGYADSVGNNQLLFVTEAAGSVEAGTEAASPPGYPWRMAMSAVSCPTTASCVGVGQISNGVVFSPNLPRAAIISDVAGKWAMQSPSLPGGDNDTWLNSVSCAAAGDCSAVGESFSAKGVFSAVMLMETAGKWAAGVMATLPLGGEAPMINDVSCASPGNCSAVGQYTNATTQAGVGLLLIETAGKWGVGGAAVLPSGADAVQVTISAVSCAAAGDCSAVGSYTDSSDAQHGLLLDEVAGKWSVGLKAPLPSNAGPNPGVSLVSVSCSTAGNCGAVGQYFDSSGNGQAFMLTETSGKWGGPVEAVLPKGAATAQQGFLDSVSCKASGSCSAVGGYRDGSGNQQGLLVAEVSGKWSAGVEAPLPSGAAPDPFVSLASVSCSSAGNCSAGGHYDLSTTDQQGLLLSETSGKWSAVEAPLPSGAASPPASSLSAVACPATGDCAAVGLYASGGGGALVETRGTLTALPAAGA